MQTATITAVALGRIALAGPLDTSPTKPVRPRLSALVASGVTAAGWLIERNALQKRGLAKEARSAVRMKDFLVTGSVVASLAALAGEQALRASAADAPREADPSMRYEKLAASVNLAFAAAAVGATPFINFALFEDYRPHPLRSLFSR